MHRIRHLAAVTAAISVALAAAAGAGATAAIAPAGPAQDYPCLGDDCQGDDELEGVGETITEVGAEEFLLTATCTNRRTVRAGRYYRTFFGKSLWKYWQQVTWCYNGVSIQSVWRDRWPQTYCCLWSFIGHVYSSCATEHCAELATSKPFSSYVSTVGLFRGCTLWPLKLCKDVNPGVTISFNAKGSWAVNSWN